VALRVGDLPERTAAVPDTGGWERFVDLPMGEVQLGDGPVRVEVLDRKPGGPLMKLRAVRLEPVR